MKKYRVTFRKEEIYTAELVVEADTVTDARQLAHIHKESGKPLAWEPLACDPIRVEHFYAEEIEDQS